MWECLKNCWGNIRKNSWHYVVIFRQQLLTITGHCNNTRQTSRLHAQVDNFNLMELWKVTGLNILCSPHFCPKMKVNQLNYLFSRLLTERTWWNSVWIKNQLDVTFCILYFSSNSCSTCFRQPCAHHQELTTAWCYSVVLVCAVAAGRLSSPVGR